MRSALLLLFLFCSCEVNGYFSGDFYDFLIQKYGETTADRLERKDLGENGSFGGRDSPKDQRKHLPIVFLHGTTMSAGDFAEHLAFFGQHGGFTEGEVFATTYGDAGLTPFKEKTMDCADVKHIRDFIQAVAAYTNSSVQILAFSMGVAVGRKATLGGRCVDTNEQLGRPLTPLVETFIAVGGVFKGLEMCTEKEEEWRACNRINGMSPYSAFLNDTNTPAFQYEGRNLFVFRSDRDRVLGTKCGREVCGATTFANRTLEFNKLDHGDLLFDLKDLQLSLLNATHENETGGLANKRPSGSSKGSASSSPISCVAILMLLVLAPMLCQLP